MPLDGDCRRWPPDQALRSPSHCFAPPNSDRRGHRRYRASAPRNARPMSNATPTIPLVAATRGAMAATEHASTTPGTMLVPIRSFCAADPTSSAIVDPRECRRAVIGALAPVTTRPSVIMSGASRPALPRRQPRRPRRPHRALRPHQPPQRLKRRQLSRPSPQPHLLPLPRLAPAAPRTRIASPSLPS